MLVSIIIIGVALAISLIIIAVVAIGMRSGVPGNASDLTLFMAKTARQLNGEAEPPSGLVRIVEAARSATSATEKD